MAQKESVNFQRNVAALCAEYGDIQRIADSAGIHRVHLSRIIHGHVVPSIDMASAIASALSVDLKDLIGSRKKLLEKLASAS